MWQEDLKKQIHDYEQEEDFSRRKKPRLKWHDETRAEFTCGKCKWKSKESIFQNTRKLLKISPVFLQ